MEYMTTAMFRQQGLGVDLSTFSDVELRSILTSAAARVNAFTSTPNLPQQHDFRGGAITDERRTWDLQASQRRLRPWHQPVKALSSLRILVTDNNYITINPDDTFINNSSGYVEIVALTLGIGVFPVVAALSLTQPVSSVNYTYGYTFPVLGEQLFETDGQTFRAANQWWDSTAVTKVYINGADSTGSFTIDYDEGTATHATELDASDVVTADYTHKLPWAIARASAVIAADEITQARIRQRGLSGLGSLSVGPGTVTLEMPRIPRSSVAIAGMPNIPEEAAWLLEPFRFRS